MYTFAFSFVSQHMRQVIEIRPIMEDNDYRKFSNISRTKSQNLYVSRPGLQLSLRNMLKPSV